MNLLKPQTPILDFSNPITKGLFLDCPLFEGAGAQARNIWRRVDGAFTGTPTWDNGVYGRVLRFSSTQGITYLDDTTQDLVTGFSMESLVKWDNTNPNNTLISKRSSYDGTGIPFEITRDGSNGISFRIIGNSANLNTGNIFASGIWYHIACTWDGSTQSIYVNGVLSTSQARSGTVTNNATNITIGMLPSGAEKMSGDVSHVRCWNRGLSINEVKQLHQNPFQIYKRPTLFGRSIYLSPAASTANSNFFQFF